MKMMTMVLAEEELVPQEFGRALEMDSLEPPTWSEARTAVMSW